MLKYIFVNLENLGTGRRQTHKNMHGRTRTFIGKLFIGTGEIWERCKVKSDLRW
jgi:hypothetical protein